MHSAIGLSVALGLTCFSFGASGLAAGSIDANQRDALTRRLNGSDPALREQAFVDMVESGDPGLLETACTFGLSNTETKFKNLGLKCAVKRLSSLNIEIDANDSDTRWIKGVGKMLGISIADYDWRTGRGNVTESFCNAGGTISVSGLAITVTGSSTCSCSGTFKLQSNGGLKGKVSCIWGYPWGTYPGTIDIQ